MNRTKAAYLEAGGTETEWQLDRDDIARDIRRRAASDAGTDALKDAELRASNDDIRRRASRNRQTVDLGEE